MARPVRQKEKGTQLGALSWRLRRRRGVEEERIACRDDQASQAKRRRKCRSPCLAKRRAVDVVSVLVGASISWHWAKEAPLMAAQAVGGATGASMASVRPGRPPWRAAQASSQ